MADVIFYAMLYGCILGVSILANMYLYIEFKEKIRVIRLLKEDLSKYRHVSKD